MPRPALSGRATPASVFAMTGWPSEAAALGEIVAPACPSRATNCWLVVDEALATAVLLNCSTNDDRNRPLPSLVSTSSWAARCLPERGRRAGRDRGAGLAGRATNQLLDGRRRGVGHRGAAQLFDERRSEQAAALVGQHVELGGGVPARARCRWRRCRPRSLGDDDGAPQPVVAHICDRASAALSSVRQSCLPPPRPVSSSSSCLPASSRVAGDLGALVGVHHGDRRVVQVPRRSSVRSPAVADSLGGVVEEEEGVGAVGVAELAVDDAGGELAEVETGGVDAEDRGRWRRPGAGRCRSSGRRGGGWRRR